MHLSRYFIQCPILNFSQFYSFVLSSSFSFNHQYSPGISQTSQNPLQQPPPPPNTHEHRHLVLMPDSSFLHNASFKKKKKSDNRNQPKFFYPGVFFPNLIQIKAIIIKFYNCTALKLLPVGSRGIWETEEYPTTYYYSFVPFSVLKNDPHSQEESSTLKNKCFICILY